MCEHTLIAALRGCEVTARERNEAGNEYAENENTFKCMKKYRRFCIFLLT